MAKFGSRKLFSPTRPHWAELVIESPCPWRCLSAPSSAVFFEASHWPSGHMTRSRPGPANFLVLQRRKEEKNYKTNRNWNFDIIWNLDLKGVNFGITQFATQFTPVSRQYRASNRKQKFKFRKNCCDTMVSDLWKNGLICP